MSNSNDRNRIDFRLRLQSYEDTSDGILLSYLTSLGTREYKELILHILRVWNLPLAHREKGDLSEEQLRVLALESCHALENRITYIRQLFFLERPPLQTQQVVINNGQGFISEKQESQQSQTPQQLPEQSQSPEQSSKYKKILSIGAVSTMAEAGEVFSMLDD